MQLTPEQQQVIDQAVDSAEPTAGLRLIGEGSYRDVYALGNGLVAPCFRTFAHDPRDMRCISDPYDYVLFDGLTVERHVKQIAFIEIKCGRGNLSHVQRSVREVVERGRVHTEIWTVGDPQIPITKQLPSAR